MLSADNQKQGHQQTRCNKLEEKQTEFPDTATFTEITERGSHRNTGEQTARNQAGHQKHNHANPQ